MSETRIIRFHGALGARLRARLGDSAIELHASTPAEALTGVTSQFPEVKAAIRPDGYYRVIAGRYRSGQTRDESGLRAPLGDARELHIAPVPRGRARGGLGKIILGAVLIAASFAVPGSGLLFGAITAASVATMGVGMVLGGVGQMLSPQPKPPAADSAERSSGFGGSALNRTDPGAVVPLAIGQFRCGSVIASGAAVVEARRVEAA